MNERDNVIPLDDVLPPLRGDLQLIQHKKDYLIFDPLRYRYFKIDRNVARILNIWSIGSAKLAISRLNSKTVSNGDYLSIEDIESLRKFLVTNHLCDSADKNHSVTLTAQAKQAKKSWKNWLLHSYLFFRVPILRPERFLTNTLPITSIFFSRIWIFCLVATAVIGLWLTSRQWDSFTNTFLHFQNSEGLFWYGVTLMCVKILHEFGHAYAATKFGSRVNTMGVAFLVMFPIFYTDTTDSWRLTKKTHRLIVDAGGVLVELAIAAIALCAWAFLPDGVLRSVAFVLATTTWILSLAVNANPLMKFDGYYLLADFLGIDNLQERSFALGRLALRKLLFGVTQECPENLSRQMKCFLITFAWCTWVYRFLLFLAIALLVYHFFFKALGVVLFAIELIWFIGLPIYRELKVYVTMKEEILKSRRSFVTASVLVLLMGIVCVPWHGTIRIPAVFEAGNYSVIYAKTPGRIEQLNFTPGQTVEVGDILIDIDSPDLGYRLNQTKRRLKILKARVDRIASDPIDRDRFLILQKDLFREQRRLTGLMEQQQALRITAPIAGTIVDVAPYLHKARWVNSKSPLLTIIDESTGSVRGYADESSIARLHSGPAVFVSDVPEIARTAVEITSRANANSETLDVNSLASTYNGPIAVSGNSEKLVPLSSRFLVYANPILKPINRSNRSVRGYLIAEGEKVSYLLRAWRRVVQVIIRELAF